MSNNVLQCSWDKDYMNERRKRMRLQWRSLALFCCCIWIGKALQSLFSKHTSLYPSSTTHKCKALTASKDQGSSHINATACPSHECSQLVHHKMYNQKIPHSRHYSFRKEKSYHTLVTFWSTNKDTVSVTVNGCMHTVANKGRTCEFQVY